MNVKCMFRTVLMVTAMAAVAAPDAQAYIDPGSGTLLWQLLLAGLVGAMFWVQRLRQWLASAVTRVIAVLKPKKQP